MGGVLGDEQYDGKMLIRSDMNKLGVLDDAMERNRCRRITQTAGP